MPFEFPQPLYPIVDTPALAEAVVAAGIRLFQLRVKGRPTGAHVEIARAVQAIASRAGASLIVNDRADIARLVGAAGVHLGQDDLPAAAARRILGPGKIVGVSTHDPAQVAAAVRDGAADYLGFGPIHSTPSKADAEPPRGEHGLREARAACALPMVAIGGLDAENAGAAIAAGADAVAVIGAIRAAADPVTATRELLLAAVTCLRLRRRS